jgi:ATP-dependent Lhr-like helicase
VLLIPQEKRARFAATDRKRRQKTITSLEFAGRWSLLRNADFSRACGTVSQGIHSANIEPNGSGQKGSSPADGKLVTPQTKNLPYDSPSRDAAIEAFARILLRRYGIVFRRLLDRESFKVSWYELGRVYRRLEARGEIRGGHFVSGISGEQFALSEAIGLLRSTRRSASKGDLLVISGADPLNLAGILTPGPRLTAITATRILLRDGVPIAALEGGKVIHLERELDQSESTIERTLKIGKLPAPLRRYYG